MTVIKDGTGSGFLAGVNKLNQLLTRSVAVAEIASASELGNSYQVDGETTLSSGTERTIIVLINNEPQNVEIQRIFLSVQNQTGVISTIKTYIGQATVASGGNARTPKNINTTSTNSLSVTVLDGNPTINSGTDVKVQEQYFQQNDTETNEYEGSLVLGTNGSVRVTCTGGSGSVGTLTADVSILYFKDNI